MRIAESELIINGDGSVFHLHLRPEELADTVNYCILLADACGINLDSAIKEKVIDTCRIRVIIRAYGGNEMKIIELERENLNKLALTADKVAHTVEAIRIEYDAFGRWDDELWGRLNSVADIALDEGLGTIEELLLDSPTLIYDGPFSDHIVNKTSAVTENLPVVKEDEAREKAAQFIGVNSDQIQLLSKTQNNLSTYTFYNSEYTVSVTQKGGIVNYMLTSQYAAQIELSTEQAIKKATEYLNNHGYSDVKESYYSTTDGICTINFSYYNNGITYYTDLIKVSVALDTGDITAFDATGYLMNHKTRTVPQNVKYTPIEAKKFIKEGLRILSYKKVFIPTEWETEEYAYEYRCVAQDEQEVLIYIDPATGEEKDVLILLYTDGGVLTK